MRFPVLRSIDIIWEGFGSHFESKILDVLVTVVFIRLSDGVVRVDAVEGGGVC
jgi:hypothetical protein